MKIYSSTYGATAMPTLINSINSSSCLFQLSLLQLRRIQLRLLQLPLPPTSAPPTSATPTKLRLFWLQLRQLQHILLQLSPPPFSRSIFSSFHYSSCVSPVSTTPSPLTLTPPSTVQPTSATWEWTVCRIPQSVRYHKLPPPSVLRADTS